MDKQSIIKVFLIAILIYYLIKVALFLLLWQILHQMEEKGRKRVEKRKRIIEEQRQKRQEKWAKYYDGKNKK
ncbi:hypothetical protein [Thermosyntropha sp.]|uniref:hypothetical protein n=1 Tax=Thermosyntropha sp. TaxID=2740820 RepID=UPI0025DBD070|nr:hypothetical protein [Thermosyntropha sp.]MBO8157983.1 hypothetical protein [Thermosyntropha sp.]